MVVLTYRTASTSAAEPATKPTSFFPDPLTEISCRFFKIGRCKNNDKCRFRHDATAEEKKAHELIPPQAGKDDSESNSGQYIQHGPKAELIKAIESNARDLGGALQCQLFMVLSLEDCNSQVHVVAVHGGSCADIGPD